MSKNINEINTEIKNQDTVSDVYSTFEENISDVEALDRGDVLKVLFEELAEKDAKSTVGEIDEDIDISEYLEKVSELDAVGLDIDGVKERYDGHLLDAKEELDQMEDGLLRFDVFLYQELDKIVKRNTSDSKVDRKYFWIFKNNDYDNVETEGGSHYSYTQLQKEVRDATLVSTSKPQYTSNDGWRKFVESLIDDFLEIDDSITGARTELIYELESIITSGVAHTDLKIAFDRGSVFYDKEEEDILIPNKQITRLCEQHGVDLTGLHQELIDRGYVSGSISERKTVDYNQQTYWRLPDSFAHPEIIDYDEESEEDDTEGDMFVKDDSLSIGGEHE